MCVVAAGVGTGQWWVDGRDRRHVCVGRAVRDRRGWGGGRSRPSAPHTPGGSRDGSPPGPIWMTMVVVEVEEGAFMIVNDGSGSHVLL